MKSSLKNAYLDADSFTIRITPTTLGKLLCGVEKTRLVKVRKALLAESLFRDRDYKIALIDELELMTKKLREKL